jgi:hypothetical protein
MFVALLTLRRLTWLEETCTPCKLDFTPVAPLKYSLGPSCSPTLRGGGLVRIFPTASPLHSLAIGSGITLRSCACVHALEESTFPSSKALRCSLRSSGRYLHSKIGQSSYCAHSSKLFGLWICLERGQPRFPPTRFPCTQVSSSLERTCLSVHFGHVHFPEPDASWTGYELSKRDSAYLQRAVYPMSHPRALANQSFLKTLA